MTYRFYDAKTGIFSGVTYSGSIEHLAQNTPSGYAAMEGEFDYLSQKVDLKSGNVIDYQPPAPADDASRIWAWDAQSKRWKSAPTLSVLKVLRVAEVQSAIEAQEKSQDRPQRELMSAFRLSLPAPAVALTRMLTIDNEISRLRALRTACASASTKAQLDEVPRP